MRRPYEHLNLRYNPFGELPPDVRAALAVGASDVQAGEVLQLVGDSGRGKTTQLLALQQQLPGSVYELVPEGSTRVVHMQPPAEGLLLDEAQRVSKRHLRRLIAAARTLVLGTHEDLSGLSARPMRTVIFDRLDLTKLDAILHRRIEAARRGPGPVPRVPRRQQQRLIDRFGNNIRAMEWLLYDIFQELRDATAPVVVLAEEGATPC